jgi:hypothetical protein
MVEGQTGCDPTNARNGKSGILGNLLTRVDVEDKL